MAQRARAKAPRRRRKLPPRKPRGTTGLAPGEKASEYPRLTVRVPQASVDKLRALSDALGLKQWRVLHAAIQAYEPTAKRKGNGDD